MKQDPEAQPESKKHNVYYMGKFIKEIEFDKMETCFLSQSYRYYNKGYLIGVMPFDYSFFASNGEIIRFEDMEEEKELPFDIVEKPILGLIPKEFYYEKVKKERYLDVCHAIKRFFDSGKKIALEYIEEYNEFIGLKEIK